MTLRKISVEEAVKCNLKYKEWRRRLKAGDEVVVLSALGLDESHYIPGKAYLCKIEAVLPCEDIQRCTTEYGCPGRIKLNVPITGIYSPKCFGNGGDPHVSFHHILPTFHFKQKPFIYFNPKLKKEGEWK